MARLLAGLGLLATAGAAQAQLPRPTFTSQPISFSTGANSFPQSVAVADVNGDGRADALVANSTDNTLGVLLGDGPGGFTPQANPPAVGTRSFPSGVVADVNGDGNPAVLTANFEDRSLGVLAGDGRGGFTNQTVLSSNGFYMRPVGVVAADVNNDGKPDALLASSTDNNLVVLLNTTAYDAPTLISLNPGSGMIGSRVTRTGTGLGGATAVRFNGTAAAFNVINATTLTATVPRAPPRAWLP